MTHLRLEPAAPRSRVKHSTTEPLRSLVFGALSYARFTLNYPCEKKERTTKQIRKKVTKNIAMVCNLNPHIWLLMTASFPLGYQVNVVIIIQISNHTTLIRTNFTMISEDWVIVH